MALPNTITTSEQLPAAADGQHYIGPFKSSGGNYYTFVVGEAGGETDEVFAYKATDPESTWTQQDSTGRPVTPGGQSVTSIWCYPVSDNIHIIFGASNNEKIYSRFDMSSDAWVEVSTGDEDIVIDSGDGTVDYCTIVVASDGDIYVGYNGDIEKVHGTNFDRVYWDKSTDSGQTWAGPTALETGVEADQANIVAVLGASDRIHFHYTASAFIIHISLSSADSLDNAQAFDTEAFSSVPNIGRGDVYTDGANERIRIPYKDSNGQISVATYTSQANPTPTIETNASDNDAEQDRGLNACIASSNSGLKESWLAYVHDTDRDLYVDVNRDGLGWGTDTEVHDAVDLAHVSCNVFVNENGETVLAMVIQDENLTDSPVQYTEHVIPTIGEWVGIGAGLFSGVGAEAPTGTADGDFNIVAAALLDLEAASTASAESSIVSAGTFNLFGVGLYPSDLSITSAAIITFDPSPIN